MSIEEHSKFSVHGSSLNRLAYGLDVFSVLLMPLYPLSLTYFSRSRIMGAAFVITILVLLLCLLTQRTVQNRWLPFLIAFILLFIHGMFIPSL